MSPSTYCVVGGAGPEDDRRGEHSVEGGQGAGGQARLILLMPGPVGEKLIVVVSVVLTLHYV